MCGRFSLGATPAQLSAAFPWLGAAFDTAPRYNIAPGQHILAIINTEPVAADLILWGLIPHWAKDKTIAYKTINARVETAANKPAYRRAFRRRRCLVPADGFYEWRKLNGQRWPMHIRRSDRLPFAFAGLWEEWTRPDGDTLRSCSILTCPPNKLVAPIHDRMPIMLREQGYQAWLDPSPREPDQLNDTLKAQLAADELEAVPVSRSVNSATFDDPSCIEPAPHPAEQQPLF